MTRLLAAIFVVVSWAALAAQEGRVVRPDPALDAAIAAGAKPELLKGDDFGATTRRSE